MLRLKDKGKRKWKVLLMRVDSGFTYDCNGEIKEHRIQQSMSQCLKGKRIAKCEHTAQYRKYQCIKSKAETESI